MEKSNLQHSEEVLKMANIIRWDPWRDAMVAPPTVVSWVNETGVVDALYLCATLGARLGR